MLQILGNITVFRYRLDGSIRDASEIIVSVRNSYTLTDTDVKSGVYYFQMPLSRYYDNGAYIGEACSDRDVIVAYNGESYTGSGIHVSISGLVTVVNLHSHDWKAGDKHIITIEAIGQIPMPGVRVGGPLDGAMYKMMTTKKII